MSSHEVRLLIECIDAFIGSFERSGEPPDCWRYFCMIDALDCLNEGNAAMAVRDMTFAETPHELRSPAEVAKMPKSITRLAAADLRLRLDDAVDSLARRA